MTTLRDVANGKYMKALIPALAKDGKTCFLVASCLGALPHQTRGLVTSPQHLHVIGADTAALDGVGQFLTGKTTCNRPDAVLDIDVIDLSAEIAQVMTGKGEWDYRLFNSCLQKFGALRDRMAKTPGVHAVIMSSLTGFTEAIQRGLSGPPNESKRGGGMDQSKWQDESRQLIECRTLLQGGPNHCFWEGHIVQTGAGDTAKEQIGIPGKTGKQWGVNVSHVFRLKRDLGSKYLNTVVEKQYLDTQPKLEFTSAGRGSTLLDPKEYDLVNVCEKLGMAIGGYAPEVKK